MFTRLSRPGVVVAGVACALVFAVIGGGPTSAQSALTGQLSLVWGDPEGGGPVQLVAYVTSPDGEQTRVQFPPGREPSYDDLAKLQHRTVVATGAGITARSTDERLYEATSLKMAASSDAAGEPAAVIGAQPWVTLRCRFGDSPTVDRAVNTSILTGSTFPSLDEYWREASYNNISVAGSVVTNWVTLPQPRSYYIGSQANLTALANDCTAASDSQVNFGSFVGINMLFNAALDCCLWGGGMGFTLDGVTKVWRATWIGLPSDNYAFLYAGLAHETGHGFGFPHSSGPYSDTYDSRWDVMSSAWVRLDSSIGQYTPQGTIAYHKDIGGWIPAARRFTPALNTSTTISLERLTVPIAASNYLMAKIPIAGSSTNFYTVEYRDLVGHDAWVPGRAVVVHRVTSSQSSSPARVVDPDNNGNPNDAAAMWTSGETFTDGASGIVVSVDSLNATSATVTVTLGTPAGRSLLVNFGSSGGLWRYDVTSAWRQLHSLAPEAVEVGDLDGNGIDDLLIDFGPPYGLWAFKNNTTWTHIHGTSPTVMELGDLDGNGMDDVIANFAGAGLWAFYNSSTWSPVHSLAPSVLAMANIDGTGGDDLIMVFPAYGVWAFKNNSTWSHIHGLAANLIAVGRLDAGTGPDDLLIGFPGSGIYQYSNNATWSYVHSLNPTRVAVGDLDGSGRDDLVLDFGPSLGVWSLANGATWSPLHGFASESLTVGDFNGNGKAEVAIDFGASMGLWLRTDAGAWQALHNASPVDLAVADLN